MWKTFLESYDENPLPVSLIGGDRDLVRALQEALLVHGYLDPPVDGIYGSVSNWALTEFCYRQGLSLGAGFTRDVAHALAAPANALPEIDTSHGWQGRAVQHMLDQGHWICRHPACHNILYIEGLNADGTVNADAPNKFNDLRCVFSITSNGQPKFTTWDGTTEPGTFWTVNPMNEDGAARIAFAQFKSWRVGIHKTHEALVQVRDVTVHRDLNQDYLRTNDETFSGLFGINQHWGYDLPKDDLGTSSAGCLVGRTKSGHRDFMRLIKSDPRYTAGRTYTFMSAIIPGDKI